ncbi:MAG: hypothetical protein ABI230_01270 [Aestuariivirga sp.]
MPKGHKGEKRPKDVNQLAKKMVDVVPSTLVGGAAEHFVMSKLLLKGKIAALAPKGVPNVDILVSDQEGNHQFAIQVKGRRNGSDRGWRMHAKHEGIKRKSLFYCFVDFEVPKDVAPKCWIVPSSIVAKTVRESHQAWLTKPGRKDSTMRSFLPQYNWMKPDPKYMSGWLNKYSENWELLSLRRKISD